MEGDFYRKEDRARYRFGSSVRRFFRRLLKNKPLTAALIFGLVFLTYATFSTHGIIQRIRLETQRRAMIRAIREANAEQDSLKKMLMRLENDPALIEKIARERYGMVREGEQVYRIQRQK